MKEYVFFIVTYDSQIEVYHYKKEGAFPVIILYPNTLIPKDDTNKFKKNVNFYFFSNSF